MKRDIILVITLNIKGISKSISNYFSRIIIKPLKLKRVFKGLNKETKELSNINNILSIHEYEIINSRVNKSNKGDFIFIL